MRSDRICGIRPRCGLLAALIVFACLWLGVRDAGARPGDPPLLDYEELVSLYEREEPPTPLREKLNRLLTTPFVRNREEAGPPPPSRSSEKLGPYIRVAFWNIERGLEYEAVTAAFQGPAQLAPLLDESEYPAGSEKRDAILREAELLRQADVIILNEVDWGMKRTDYRNVVEDLAAALGMNFAFGVEFVETDPINLGIEQFENAVPEDRAELVGLVRVDTGLYRGLHGNAILSRFPIENVRLVPFRNQPHDWYADEKKGVSKVEKGVRKAGEIAFREKSRQSVRRGGRTMLIADLVGPGLPGGRVTVVSTHLENRTQPRNRVRQLEELLDEIKGVKNAVIIAGDMNTSTRDSTPTSVRREIKKRLGSKSYWLKQGLKYATGLELPYGLVRSGLNVYRKQADPTVRHIPWVAPNPEAKFFSVLKRFRFADGGAFDFRGDRERSAGGNGGALSNSNQRGGKGFVTTFEVERRIGFVGKFKLDWIFVKPPGLSDPEGDGQPYLFAPHFGRTLKDLNHAVADGISDHSPLIVDLPLGEPPLR